jgi:Crinkler effector protein N-terminal domain
MDDRPVFPLYAFVQDDTTLLNVTVAADDHVYKLKKLIYKEGKNGILHNVDAKDLSLWMVSSFQML